MSWYLHWARKSSRLTALHECSLGLWSKHSGLRQSKHGPSRNASLKLRKCAYSNENELDLEHNTIKHIYEARRQVSNSCKFTMHIACIGQYFLWKSRVVIHIWWNSKSQRLLWSKHINLNLKPTDSSNALTNDGLSLKGTFLASADWTSCSAG